MKQANLSNSAAYLVLMREIEDLLYAEADLLTDDIRYWMPMRKNVAIENLAREATVEDDVAGSTTTGRR